MLPHTLIRPLLAVALALAGHASARAETLEGLLERGPAHSVLWFASPESGDLIGQVFANASPVGQLILRECLPGLACAVQGAGIAEPDGALVQQLHFADQPSGWWLITQADSADMQASLPLAERTLRTRFGLLRITEEQQLLWQERPVLAPPAPDYIPAPAPAPAPTAAPTLLERLSAWWQHLRQRILALFGRHADTDTTAPPAAAGTTGTIDVVQGNTALHIVAHYAAHDSDIVLLQDTGGTACPALYRFASVTAQGIAVTPTFGTCSDIAGITFGATPDAAPEPLVTMAGFLGPFEPEAQRQRARMQVHRFALRQGRVHPLPAAD